MKRDLQNSDLNSLLPDVQVDRRGFVAACIAAGFAVSAQPVVPVTAPTGADITSPDAVSKSTSTRSEAFGLLAFAKKRRSGCSMPTQIGALTALAASGMLSELLSSADVTSNGSFPATTEAPFSNQPAAPFSKVPPGLSV